MTTENSIEIHGHTFAIVLDPLGAEHVKLGDLCAPFALNLSGQRERLKNAGWGTVEKIYSVRSSGKRAAFLCLPLRRVAMFFATLQANHVKPAYRDALVAMQNEAADAIDDYYRKGGAFRTSAAPIQLRTLQETIEDFLRAVPLDEPIWPARFVKRYEAWNGRVWNVGDRQPFSMRNANWFFYEMVYPPAVLAIIKAKGLEEGARYHQVLADVPRDHLGRQLEIASAIAEDCGSEREWRIRMRRLFKKTKANLLGQGDLDL